jgi:hypothetical protein
MNVTRAANHALFEYVIVIISIGVLLLTLYLCVKYLLKPGEKDESHIKKKILDDEVRHDRKGRP